MQTIHLSISPLLPLLLLLLNFGLAVPAVIHAIMTKEQVQSAVGWVGIIILSPFIGSLLYFCLGVNRISRRWDKIRQRNYQRVHDFFKLRPPVPLHNPAYNTQFGDNVSPFPMLDGNQISMLRGGSQTYPAMLDAIRQAQRTIALQSYIFDSGETGDIFIEALGDAVKRGVEVSVLIDGVGAIYSKTSVARQLRARGVKTALFIDKTLGVALPYANMRNHRKIMIVDGQIAFTGGMNIRDHFTGDVHKKGFTQDTHFRIEGPITEHLLAVFAQDWYFAKKEKINGGFWFKDEAVPPKKTYAAARVIPSEPHDQGHANLWVISNALARARKRVMIQSPYFVPPLEIMNALRLVALRGVEVDLILPRKSNLFFVDCAAMAQLHPLIQSGCRLWHAAPPFDHSKLMLIDDDYAYVGSTNMDTRSLRLNFEIDLEVVDAGLVKEIQDLMQETMAQSTPITMATLQAFSFPRQFFNRLAWLFSPYL